MGHNAGWYNKLGEKLGWGDISIGDFQRICREIEGDELFITLSERDSFWELVVDLGASASTAVMSPSAEAPGVEYVAEKCHYIIGRDEIYHIDNNDSGDRVIIKGLSFKVLSREAAKILITSATS